MKRGWLAAAPAVAVLFLSGCFAGDFGLGLGERETVEETRSLAPNGSFELENTNGRVTVTTWDESRVRIEAEKAASTRSALRDLEVVIKGEGDKVSVETRYPHHVFFGRAGRVDYRISVPRTAQVRVRSVNGRVEIDGVAGAVNASTVNGAVELTHLGGKVAASTVNGSVTASLARLDPDSSNDIDTTNGSVRVTLPSDAGAEIDARTVNGSIHCDFDLSEGGRSGRHRLEGTIGKGGARFQLRTVNGSVHVDRGLAASAARRPAEAEPGSVR
jgi:DUF4097 and DUF4098 domain-containing protein YvlB